jgi:hypothetical protein
MHRMGFTSRSPVASTTRRFRPKQIEPRDRRPRFDRNLVLREAHHEGHRSAFPRSRKIAVPPALPAARPGIAIPRKKGAECRARGCGRPRVKAVGRGEPSQRRQADSLQRASRVHRAACHGDVLSGLSREMARHWKRRGTASDRIDARDGSYREVAEKGIWRYSGRARPRSGLIVDSVSAELRRRQPEHDRDRNRLNVPWLCPHPNVWVACCSAQHDPFSSSIWKPEEACDPTAI